MLPTLRKISDGSAQRIFGVHRPLSERTNMESKRSGGDNVDHILVEKAHSINGALAGQIVDDLLRQDQICSPDI
jgi:hypothetical protein